MRTKVSGAYSSASAASKKPRRSPLPNSSVSGLSWVKSQRATSTSPRSVAAPARNRRSRSACAPPWATTERQVARPATAPRAPPRTFVARSRFEGMRSGRYAWSPSRTRLRPPASADRGRDGGVAADARRQREHREEAEREVRDDVRGEIEPGDEARQRRREELERREALVAPAGERVEARVDDEESVDREKIAREARRARLHRPGFYLRARHARTRRARFRRRRS